VVRRNKICFSQKRLFIISAGNFRETLSPSNYPAENDTAAVENPCQSWNSLVVGACTQKSLIGNENAAFSLFAPSGSLSPRSRTSVTWSKQWPIRPDVVMEGGNFVHDGHTGFEAPELRLISTNSNIADAQFRTFGDTSGASALAARMSALIAARYPDFWPETLRALIIHSADWTQSMRDQVGGGNSRASRNLLLRRYGFGVPDLHRALASADNDANLVIEDTLQPFRLEGGAGKSNEMVVHNLPWPRAELQQAGANLVRIKITLSYFVEPNPGKAWSRKHAYQSYALRFAFKRSTETLNAFRARINAAIESEETGSTIANDEWYLGPLRNSGSIHSDVWEATGAAAADMDAFAVYPVGGWWKNNASLGMTNSEARYSAIVSITAPTNVNVYTAIDTIVKQQVAIETGT
jgi:Subtilase family